MRASAFDMSVNSHKSNSRKGSRAVAAFSCTQLAASTDVARSSTWPQSRLALHRSLWIHGRNVTANRASLKRDEGVIQSQGRRGYSAGHGDHWLSATTRPGGEQRPDRPPTCGCSEHAFQNPLSERYLLLDVCRRHSSSADGIGDDGGDLDVETVWKACSSSICHSENRATI